MDAYQLDRRQTDCRQRCANEHNRGSEEGIRIDRTQTVQQACHSLGDTKAHRNSNSYTDRSVQQSFA